MQTPAPGPPARSDGLSPALRRLLTFGLAGVVAALDQVVKVIVDNVLPPWGATVGPLFDFQRVYNPGVNFGLLSEYPQVVLAATLIIGIGFAAYALARPPQRWDDHRRIRAAAGRRLRQLGGPISPGRGL